MTKQKDGNPNFNPKEVSSASEEDTSSTRQDGRSTTALKNVASQDGAGAELFKELNQAIIKTYTRVFSKMEVCCDWVRMHPASLEINLSVFLDITPSVQEMLPLLHLYLSRYPNILELWLSNALQPALSFPVKPELDAKALAQDRFKMLLDALIN